MERKPNILVICCDQLTWRALPYYGNTYADTPNINSITENGTGFDACYCSFPLCQPSRASFWSGLYPHETNVLSNGRRWPVDKISQDVPTIGSVFSQAGYHTVHFGKTHDAGALRGFDCTLSRQIPTQPVSDAWPLDYDTLEDRDTAANAAEFLRNEKGGPYFAVVDLNNPHDICNWIGTFRDEHEDIDPGVDLPELPENFEFDDIKNRPVAVQYICCSHNRQAQTGVWKPESFRYYLAAYYHYLNRADSEIGLVLDALNARDDRDNTIIVFMADHGDGMAARRRVTKQVDLYEEVTRVPFLFSGPGIKKTYSPIQGFPVSTLDLFPTLCGLVGIQAPDTIRGVDLSAVLRGETADINRDYVVSQWHTEWGYTVSPGRMIRSRRYKYTYYIEDQCEELFDLQTDPYEKVNQAANPQYAQALSQMREHFRAYLEETGDSFLSLSWYADPQWRSHEVGYHNHRGPAAPEATDPPKKQP